MATRPQNCNISLRRQAGIGWVGGWVGGGVCVQDAYQVADERNGLAARLHLRHAVDARVERVRARRPENTTERASVRVRSSDLQVACMPVANSVRGGDGNHECEVCPSFSLLQSQFDVMRGEQRWNLVRGPAFALALQERPSKDGKVTPTCGVRLVQTNFRLTALVRLKVQSNRL